MRDQRMIMCTTKNNTNYNTQISSSYNHEGELPHGLKVKMSNIYINDEEVFLLTQKINVTKVFGVPLMHCPNTLFLP